MGVFGTDTGGIVLVLGKRVDGLSVRFVYNRSMSVWVAFPCVDNARALGQFHVSLVP